MTKPQYERNISKRHDPRTRWKWSGSKTPRDPDGCCPDRRPHHLHPRHHHRLRWKPPRRPRRNPQQEDEKHHKHPHLQPCRKSLISLILILKTQTVLASIFKTWTKQTNKCLPPKDQK